MTDRSYARYIELTQQHPELFAVDGPGFIVLPPVHGISEVAYEDAFVCVVRDYVRLPGGDKTGYIRILAKPLNGAGAAILPIVNGKVLLLRQYRHALPGLHLEIPRGFAEIAETPRQAATRELAEETGLQGFDLQSLGWYTPDSGILASRVELFCMVTENSPFVMTEPGVDYTFVTSAELDELIGDGTVEDGFTIAATFRARLRGFLK
jgi:ADP-ribose pyrophosphatase